MQGFWDIKDKSEATLVMLFSAAIAGQAIYYFVSGRSHENTDIWNAFVVLQFDVATGVLIWGWRKSKSFSEKPGSKK